MAIIGGAGGDRLEGNAGDNVIRARSGGDRVSGRGGDDQIAGGHGRDTLFGGDGDDLIFGCGGSDGRPGSDAIAVRPVAEGFAQPVYATAAPGDDPRRLYVVEMKTGRIEILDTRTGEINDRPFLDLPDDLLSPNNEQGLLGLAFHPDYATNGRFFVFITNADGDVELRSYRRSPADPDRAVAGSGDVILRIDRDNGGHNHDGGWIGFGPDGMLYATVGDEGFGGDQSNNGQNLASLWGKILRIDVDGDDFAGEGRDYAIPADNPFVGRAGRDEVWALGLRSPWRASFDRETGDFWLGDVGQDRREEINVVRAGHRGGVNFGWKVKEGDLVYDDTVPGNPRPGSPALTAPLLDYPHAPAPGGGNAVVGGYVHRGADGGMHDRYLYADFISDRLWGLRLVNNRAVDVTDHTAQLIGAPFSDVTSFAEDGRGYLYVVDIGGTVSRLRFGDGSGDSGDQLFGGDGRDRMFGGAGDDRLRGGHGRDRLDGGGQDDRLAGEGGDDRIHGGQGLDRLDGGGQNDRLAGGSGADVFLFRPGSGRDTVADFRDDVDAISLRDFGFADVAEALEAASNRGGDVVFALGHGDRLTVADTTRSALADDLLV